MPSRRTERDSHGHGPRVPNGANGRIWLKEERRTLNACRRPLGGASHQRQKYQIPAKHDRTECIDLDSPCEIESHEGFVTPHASLRSSSSLHPARPSGRSWTVIARWSNEPFRPARRTIAPNATIPRAAAISSRTEMGTISLDDFGGLVRAR